ncbi:type III polyketide synthase [Natronoflexus pectinivorans]|uniref:Putative naringenin-chalcone synthase n=1 Tax=Natronoflexus pectinivorans TaxID=682526 RepID=A0A4R2GPR0_9BACT|nr:type III polyketide synthase [Natronoflexus pectinivorans]TCO11077.1 putative naringenin-chalcone synthase [Natronoflexus pectinivorans]
MGTIISIGTAVPKYGAKQSTILEFMKAAYNDDTASRKLNILFHNSGIKTRYSILSDFGNYPSENSFFKQNIKVPDVTQRTALFKENASSLAISALKNALQKLNTNMGDLNITHLITVTCTGVYAPGLGAELIEQLDLPDDTFHTAINYMGCNAAFPALNLADMITKTNENAKVLIVCVELCTLHFQPVNNSDNLLANTIFGDGSAAVVVVSDRAARRNQQSGLSLNGFYSLLLNKGKNLMGWNITPNNFEMVLDGGIPDFIGNEVNEVIMKASKKLNTDPLSIDKWAIHPGGKKILDAIKKQTQLSDYDVQYSYKVLSDYGNMSSPTILFVLNEIMKAENTNGETIFSIGFGPGLSIETALLTYVTNRVEKSYVGENADSTKKISAGKKTAEILSYANLHP